MPCPDARSRDENGPVVCVLHHAYMDGGCLAGLHSLHIRRHSTLRTNVGLHLASNPSISMLSALAGPKSSSRHPSGSQTATQPGRMYTASSMTCRHAASRHNLVPRTRQHHTASRHGTTRRGVEASLSFCGGPHRKSPPSHMMHARRWPSGWKWAPHDSATNGRGIRCPTQPGHALCSHPAL